MKRLPSWPSDLAAAITAGGQSRRFGQDKALYVLGGESLLARVSASLNRCSPRLLVAPAGRYRLSDWQVCPDLRPGEGPLAGLETALSALHEQHPAGGWLAFSAVDLPYLTPAYWALLSGSIGPGVQAVVGLDPGGRPQPLAALYHTSARPTVTALLDAGERRMGALLARLEADAGGVGQLDWPQVEAVCPLAYVNLNTPPSGGGDVPV